MSIDKVDPEKAVPEQSNEQLAHASGEVTDGLMDWLTFASSLVGSLAWPVVTLIALLAFREKLGGLMEAVRERIPAVQRFSIGGFEVWTPSAVEEVSKEVGEELPKLSSESGSAEVERESIAESLAKIRPSAGVLDAFIQIEKQITRYISEKPLSIQESALRTFEKDESVSAQLRRVVRELANLRNAAAHGLGEVTEDSALEYIKTARKVERQISLLTDSMMSGQG